MSNIECPNYGDTVPELQQSIADAPSDDFFDDTTINQGYQYLLASIKNSAKYETDYRKLKEMHTYLVRLYALLNAYKTTLEPNADESTRTTLSNQLQQFGVASLAISDNYDNYADMPKWKQNAGYWGTIFGCIALGLLIGAAGGAISFFLLPLMVCSAMAIFTGSLPAAALTFCTFVAIWGGTFWGAIGSIIGASCGPDAAKERIYDRTKRPRDTFFQKQYDLIAKVPTQPTTGALAPAEHHGEGNDEPHYDEDPRTALMQAAV